MKTSTAVLFSLFAIAGCASVDKTMSGLNNLIGKDAELAFLVLGYPTQKQEFINDIVYEWSVNESGFITLPQTTFISGTVGTTPVYGSIQGTRTIQTRSVCDIKIVTDRNNRIKGREISGNYAGCGEYMSRLSKFADMTGAVNFVQKTEFRTSDTIISDANAEKEILELIKMAGESSNIKATVFNKKVAISGVMTSRNKADKLVADIKQLQGVEAIGDELELTTAPQNYPASIDSFIENAINFQAHQDDELKRIGFKINVIYGKVILMGVVTRIDGQKLAEIASRVGGVKLVIKRFEIIQ